VVIVPGDKGFPITSSTATIPMGRGAGRIYKTFYLGICIITYLKSGDIYVIDSRITFYRTPVQTKHGGAMKSTHHCIAAIGCIPYVPFDPETKISACCETL
jgi:hypothetical protein